MTIEEAHKQYEKEVQICIEEHNRSCEKNFVTSIIVGSILIVLGIILLVIGNSIPPEIASYGEYETAGAILCKCFGTGLLVGGIPFLLLMPRSIRKKQKEGPKSFWVQNKRLLLNYLKCEDMNQEGKEHYRQELEEMKHLEVLMAINRASNRISGDIAVATMYTTIMK